jgi:hypothetical protein
VLLIALLVAAATAPAPSSPSVRPRSILASYSFEDAVATGPDTFAIWQGARHTGTGRGSVLLSSAFHVSGYRSVELKDVAGDGDFPELQGYFPAQRAGRLFFHFAFLTTNENEELNIALAGPRHFGLEKDGIAFWLRTEEGNLVQVSDRAHRKLFAVEPFVWYAADVAYDVAAGTYALTIRQEGVDAPRVALRDQPNAPREPGSAVDKFSFVGSPYVDRSNVVYYVDDVVVGTDESVTRLPFVAPGRRKLFVDLFGEYQRRLRERPRCLPVTSLADLGLDTSDLAAAGREALMQAAERYLADAPADAAPTAALDERLRQVFAPATEWQAGCAALDRGEYAAALARFDQAAAAAPGASLFPLSAVVALAALKRFGEADERLASLADFRADPRYAAVSAYVGVLRGDLDRALEWLRDPASRILDREVNPLVALFLRRVPPGALASFRGQLKDAFPDRLEETLLAEQYYYVQLWKERYDGARDYALRMDDRLRRAGLPTTVWAERAADAAFYRRDLAEAGALYTAAIGSETDHGALMILYLKLADVAHLTGDLETERMLREHYYGTLTE